MLNQTLLALAVFSILVTLAAFASSASAGILMAIFVKPFIDSAWSSLLANQVNPGRVFGVLAPMLILWAILAKKRVANIPCMGIWLTYVAYAFVTAVFMLINKGLLDAVQSFFRTLNGFVGFLMIQTYFYQKASFRKLLLVLIATGIFPIGVGVYQAVTGVVWNYDASLGLVRYSGFFHDIAALRQYILQTVVGLLLYWSYFRPVAGRNIKRLLSLALACLGALVLFKTYSKAAILIVVAWLLIWGWGRRRFVPIMAIALITIVLNILYADRLWTETELLFSRETAALDEETGDDATARDRALAGRMVIWQDYW